MIETLQALPFLHSLESIRSPFLTAVMKIITLMGHEILPVAVICLFYWCINKKLAYRLGIVFFASGVAVQTLKLGFRIERPVVLDSTLNPVKGSLVGDTGYSFPSGHTQGAASLFCSLAFCAKKWYAKLILILLPLAVMFSRLYFGVHTPLDVGAAFVITLLIVLVLFPYSEKLLDSGRYDLATALVMFFVCSGVLVYSAILFSSGTVPYENISDGFKTVGSGIGFSIGYYIERKYVNFDVRTKNIWMQIVKMAVGIGSGLGFKAALKAICGQNIYSDAGRYVFLVLWIIALYPMIIKKYFQCSGESR